MPRDSRTYITLHDGMPEHPKVEVLTDKAFRALVDLWCWCSRNRTDGKVREAVWVKRVPARIRTELTASGMVEPSTDGVVMHDYLEHQRSAAEIDELSEKRRAAGSKGGSRKAAKAAASATASARPVAKQTPSKSVADTESEVPTTSGEASAPPAAESHEQRVNRITKTYTDLVPLSKFVAIRAVVSKALRIGYDETALVDALSRLAEDRRTVTTDTLRIELEGFPISNREKQDAARPESPEERHVRDARERQRAAS